MNGARLYVGSKNSSALATRTSTFAARPTVALPPLTLRAAPFDTFDALEVALITPPSPPLVAKDSSPLPRGCPESLHRSHPPPANFSAANPPPRHQQSSRRARHPQLRASPLPASTPSRPKPLAPAPWPQSLRTQSTTRLCRRPARPRHPSSKSAAR